MDIVLGIDFDKDARKTYEANFPEAGFIGEDIRQIGLEALQKYVQVNAGENLVFCGCAPCQPFTKVNTVRKANDERTDLLSEFGRFVAHYLPAYVVVENVPGLQKVKSEGPFPAFVALLESHGYQVVHKVVSCHHFGVPQTRKRLVLVAAKVGPAPWPKATYGPGTSNLKYSAVWDWISDLPRIKAGEEHPDVPNHRAAALSKDNLKRIRATKRGKGRECWPDELKLKCHTSPKEHSDVYGRLRKSQPAAALTTRCISLSNGRFGHPEQHRAISVREAACLQTFDRDFVFSGSLNSMARQIGNAVPVLLAANIGKAIVEHARNLKESSAQL